MCVLSVCRRVSLLFKLLKKGSSRVLNSSSDDLYCCVKVAPSQNPSHALLRTLIRVANDRFSKFSESAVIRDADWLMF